jgi:hypothetical protein
MKKLHLQLLSTVVITSSLAATANQTDHVRKQVFDTFRQILGLVNKASQNFLSQNNSQPMKQHAESLNQIKEQGEQKIKELRVAAKDQAPLLELLSYAEHIMKEFGRFVAVVNEFKNAGPKQAAPFISKLSNTVDAMELFNQLTQKVNALYKKYENTDKAFSEALLQFVNSIRVIVKQWEDRYKGKSEREIKLAMLDAICFRMSIKS